MSLSRSVKLASRRSYLVLLTSLVFVLLLALAGCFRGGGAALPGAVHYHRLSQEPSSSPTTYRNPSPHAQKYMKVQSTIAADFPLTLHKPKNATCNHPPRHNGVIVYTLGANAADQKAEMLGEIAIALSRLEDQFNQYACYPILLFHTGLLKSEQLKLATYTTAEMKLIDVSAVWHFPPVLIDEIAAQNVTWDEICRCGASMKFPPDYCLMGPWWIYYIFKTGYLKPYDYWWRMDTDTYLISPLPTDPFDLIAQRKFAFSYVQFEESEMEFAPCITSLHDTAVNYAKLAGAVDTQTRKMLENRGGRWSGWWAVAETKFFHSEAYFGFTSYLVENWPWRERWGEQAVWPVLFGFFDDLPTFKYPWREYLIHKQDANPEIVKAQCSQQLAPLCMKHKPW